MTGTGLRRSTAFDTDPSRAPVTRPRPRAAVVGAEGRKERVSVFATTPRKHTQILSKAPDTVVAAIEDVTFTLSTTTP